MNDRDYISPEILAANDRFDREHPDWKREARSELRPGYREYLLMRRGKLTDKQITKYQALGWYSDAFREARRERVAKKTARSQAYLAKREGNFTLTNGRMIYNPV